MSKIKLDFNYECKNSVVLFNVMDNGTSRIVVDIESFGEKVELDNSIAVVAVLKPSGKVHSQFGDIKGNQVILNLEESSLNEVGIYTARLLLISGDKRKMTRSFKYEVEQENILSQILNDVVQSSDYPLLTDMLSRLSTIENDEEQRKLNEAQRILNEDARVEAESLRVEAELTREHNDADREKAEAVRGTNENNRVKAEKLRSTNEDARVGAESSRVEAENLRVEAENLRNDNYSFMTEDENRRRSNEDTRVKAEAERVKVEVNRVSEESKRRTVETARVKAEGLRVKAETLRVGAETKRVEAEASRVEAERIRSSRYESLIGEAERSVQNFNSYASSAKLEEAERSDNENSRVEAEKLRSSNESTRINDEKIRVKNEQLRIEKEATRNNVFDAKVAEVNSKVNEVDTAKNAMVADTKKAIDKMTNDFNSLSASQQQDAEVILARDGEESLNARLVRDLFIGDKSLKQEVIDLGGLKESQDMAYSTDKGCLVCKETRNGTIKDLKISGKSLVNQCDYSVFNDRFNDNYYRDRTICETSKLKLDTYYTVVIFKKFNAGHSLNYNQLDFGVGSIFNGVNGHPNMTIGDSDATQYQLQYNSNSEEVLVEKIKFKDFKGFKYFSWRPCRRDTQHVPEEFADYNIKIILLEGDYTQNPPTEHFEGIASVGNGADIVEVSSCWGNGNLVDNEKIFKDVQFDNVNGDIINKLHTKGAYNVFDDNTQYIVDYKVDIVENPDSNITFAIINYKDGSYEYVSDYTKPATSKKPVKSITWTYGHSCKVKNAELVINKAGVDKTNICKSDKKPILFKDSDRAWKSIKELRGLEAVCDTIELHSDGKYYYHQRTDVLIIDGVNTLFTNTQNTSEGNKRVGVVKPFIQNKKSNASSIMVMCDKIPSVTFNSRANLGIYITCNDILEHNGIWWTNNIFENTDTRLLLEEANN